MSICIFKLNILKNYALFPANSTFIAYIYAYICILMNFIHTKKCTLCSVICPLPAIYRDLRSFLSYNQNLCIVLFFGIREYINNVFPLFCLFMYFVFLAGTRTAKPFKKSTFFSIHRVQNIRNRYFVWLLHFQSLKLFISKTRQKKKPPP